jgi:glycosyltransferase involved in cell wall biosynthesis
MDSLKRNIYINGYFFSKRITGIERYAREITSELDALVTPEDNISIVVPDLSTVDIRYKNIKVIENKGHVKGLLWDYLSFPFYIRKNKGFAVHLCNHPVIFTGFMTVLHDISYRADFSLHKGFSNRLRIVWNCVNYWWITHFARYIVTDSEFSRSEIKRFFHTKKTKDIDIVYCGWEHMRRITDSTDVFSKYSYLEKNKYYFSMATLSRNKNFQWILKVAEKQPDLIFAIAGGGKLKSTADELGYSKLKNVFFLGYVSDGDAKALMKNCTAFVFPTLYEGFGLPPLEAAACGACNLIVSDTPCMHEIYKNNATYIDPYDYSGNADIIHMNRLDTDALLSEYSWKKSAEKLYRIICEL